ncbi:hypothetical protein RND71_015536 [Anisodus tanguticus]|uniref:Uncharacterized protein n=1 Tax=Anisodus tanguticus TaxID=243964 RepID=A0AAE1VBW9_9SOLA|nr:hypothetical protein RND71_015536 [Anisodus tanguticus]
MAAEEPSNYSTPKLPLSLSTPTMKLKYSSQHSTGILTPPLNTTLVSIPFKWEEQPGKPRPCTDLIISIFNDHKPKCLEPPPARLYYLENTKMPSPTTVLDGPYSNIERGKLGTLVLYNKNNKVHSSRGYWWHRFVKRRRVGGGNRKETGVGEGNFVFSSSSHVDSTNSSVKMARDRRNAKSNSHILDFMTGMRIMRCDSTGDLYPITTIVGHPTSSPSTFAAISSLLWHNRLGHSGDCFTPP